MFLQEIILLGAHTIWHDSTGDEEGRTTAVFFSRGKYGDVNRTSGLGGGWRGEKWLCHVVPYLSHERKG